MSARRGFWFSGEMRVLEGARECSRQETRTSSSGSSAWRQRSKPEPLLLQVESDLPFVRVWPGEQQVMGVRRRHVAGVAQQLDTGLRRARHRKAASADRQLVAAHEQQLRLSLPRHQAPSPTEGHVHRKQLALRPARSNAVISRRLLGGSQTVAGCPRTRECGKENSLCWDLDGRGVPDCPASVRGVTTQWKGDFERCIQRQCRAHLVVRALRFQQSNSQCRIDRTPGVVFREKKQHTGSAIVVLIWLSALRIAPANALFWKVKFFAASASKPQLS